VKPLILTDLQKKVLANANLFGSKKLLRIKINTDRIQIPEVKNKIEDELKKGISR